MISGMFLFTTLLSLADRARHARLGQLGLSPQALPIAYSLRITDLWPFLVYPVAWQPSIARGRVH